MPKQIDLDGVYMGVALLHSQLSKANRAKVGACLVTETGVVIPGYNGTPRGLDNACERHYITGSVTKDEVIHAELNAVLKCSLEGISTKNSTLYVTLSPCLRCSSMLVQAGVKRVVFREQYRDNSGVELLRSAGVLVDC
jgi:dCMP deaminase